MAAWMENQCTNISNKLLYRKNTFYQTQCGAFWLLFGQNFLISEPPDSYKKKNDLRPNHDKSIDRWPVEDRFVIDFTRRAPPGWRA